MIPRTGTKSHCTFRPRQEIMKNSGSGGIMAHLSFFSPSYRFSSVDVLTDLSPGYHCLPGSGRHFGRPYRASLHHPCSFSSSFLFPPCIFRLFQLSSSFPPKCQFVELSSSLILQLLFDVSPPECRLIISRCKVERKARSIPYASSVFLATD